MDYPLMEPHFEDMNKKQVEQYFQWFMGEREKRISQLELYAKKAVKRK